VYETTYKWLQSVVDYIIYTTDFSRRMGLIKEKCMDRHAWLLAARRLGLTIRPRGSHFFSSTKKNVKNIGFAWRTKTYFGLLRHNLSTYTICILCSKKLWVIRCACHEYYVLRFFTEFFFFFKPYDRNAKVYFTILQLFSVINYIINKAGRLRWNG